ncbi:nitrogen regulation protein NR(II) [Acidihalobacter ferrooxydans]|uniref:histidine kinase n=1 Tax=Acidihalobacter ferrooxydans TaxID=1765967 RepID=A0A1P8UDN4_9GAMM|nr:nitrogen regulation protein NR(II) [Acidihalobacter ferrooxydans]APZ41923.1 two-component system sensor histidine kinase NtrB [Acidihalobacter ferrooxydans]
MTERALQTNLVDTRPILDGLVTSVFMFDRELHLIYLNPAGEMLLEHGVSNLLGLPAEDVFPGDDDFLGAMGTVMSSMHTQTEREKNLSLLGRREITADYAISPCMAGVDVNGVLVELAQVDRQLRITRERRLLSQQVTARRLLRGLAHEIKNPLSGLRGAAQLLERELDSEDLREYTRIIISEADRLRALVDRMLGPNSRPRLTLVNVHEILDRVCQLVLIEPSAGVALSKDYDPSIPELRLDRDMIIQAVLNIVQNALHALEGHGEIQLRTRIARNYNIGGVRHRLIAVIEVHDNGPGVPENLLDRIFYPMVSGHADGTGLGLAISQSLVTQHGGLIECQSRPGHTIFTLLLPVEANA